VDKFIETGAVALAIIVDVLVQHCLIHPVPFRQLPSVTHHQNVATDSETSCPGWHNPLADNDLDVKSIIPV
jgi:hypothetical protein